MGFMDFFKKRHALNSMVTADVAKEQSKKRQDELTERILTFIFSAHINPAIKEGKFSCVYKQGFGDVPECVISKLKIMGYYVEYFNDGRCVDKHQIQISWGVE